MAFCDQCGAQLSPAAAFCSGCGKQAGTPSAVPLAARQSAFEPASVPAGAPPADDQVGLPEKWRQRFAAIEKAGGERTRWWRWPQAKQLTGKEKRLITSNLWAFVFGPLYYLYAGLWRKAVTLSLVALVIDLILGMAGDALNLPIDNFLWIVSAVMFRQCANVDYYRKTVLNRREWW